MDELFELLYLQLRFDAALKQNQKELFRLGATVLYTYSAERRSNFKKSTRPDTTVKRKADNVHMDVDEAGKVTVFLFANPPSQLGHSFCRDCISRHLSNSDRCPVTRRPLTTKDLRPNLMANTLVDELEVHCTYGCQFADNGWELDEDGCTETTTFGLRKAHQKVCEHRPVTCPYGGVRCDLIPRIDLE
eukprot:gene9866-11683_t